MKCEVSHRGAAYGMAIVGTNRQVSRHERAHMEFFVRTVEEQRSRPHIDLDVTPILAEVQSPDEETRARAVREICPCRMPMEIFAQLRPLAKQLSMTLVLWCVRTRCISKRALIELPVMRRNARRYKKWTPMNADPTSGILVKGVDISLSGSPVSGYLNAGRSAFVKETDTIPSRHCPELPPMTVTV